MIFKDIELKNLYLLKSKFNGWEEVIFYVDEIKDEYITINVVESLIGTGGDNKIIVDKSSFIGKSPVIYLGLIVDLPEYFL